MIYLDEGGSIKGHQDHRTVDSTLVTLEGRMEKDSCITDAGNRTLEMEQASAFLKKNFRNILILHVQLRLLRALPLGGFVGARLGGPEFLT